MVFTRKRRNRRKKQLSDFNETLNDFVIGSHTNERVIENEALEFHSDGRYGNSDRFLDGEVSACQNQVIRNNFDDKIRKAVDNALMTVENCLTRF